jgi:Predicted integral membrane protein (DUF2269).
MDWLEGLVVIHVLSALIGIGPTYLGHVLLRRNQSVQQFRTSFGYTKAMDLFPKIGGTIAVLSGVGLALTGRYGSFAQIWMLGSLVIYIFIQIIMAAAFSPNMKKLQNWLFDPSNLQASVFPAEQQQWVNRASSWLYAASGLGIVLFIFMILKPAA